MRIALLLFITTSSFLLTLNAQNFSVEPNPAYAEADLDNPSSQPDFMQALASISNNTSDTLFLKWERVLEDTPDGWKTTVCEPNLCVFPNVNTREFILYPNVIDQAMYVEAYPGMYPGGIPQNGAVPGIGEVHLKISNLNDPSDTLIAVYLFTLVGSPILDLTEPELEQINIFPNPATDYFMLSETKEIDRIIVYNILGQQVKTFEVNGNQYFEINDFPNGNYVINLMNKDQEMLKALRLQKH